MSEGLAFFWRRWAILAQDGAVVGLHAPDGIKLEALLACTQLSWEQCTCPCFSHWPLCLHLLEEVATLDDALSSLFLPARVVVTTREVERVQHGTDGSVNGEADPRD